MKKEIKTVNLSDYVEVDTDNIEVSCDLTKQEMIDIINDQFYDNSPLDDVAFVWTERLKKLDKEDLIKLCIKLVDTLNYDIDFNGELIC